MGIFDAIGEGAVVAITIKAIDQFSGTFRDAEIGADGLGKAAGFLQAGLALAATAAVAAGTAIAAFGVSSVKAAMETEAAQNRLAQILKTSRGATDEQIDSLFRQAEALEKVGVVANENILITQSQLATFDLEVASIQTLTPAILDYVVAEKGANASTDEFKQMTNGLAQALNGNFASLTRTGFVLDDATKALISTGTEEERVAAITKVLNSTYKDFNEKAKDTAEGGLKALQNQFNNLKEDLGKQLLPVLVDLTKVFSEQVLPAIEPLIPILGEFLKNALESIMPYLPRMMEGFTRLVEIFMRVFDALTPLMGPLMELSFIIFDALLDVIEPLIPSIEKLALVIADILDAIMPLLLPLIDLIALLLDLAGNVIMDTLIVALQILEPALRVISFVLGLIVEAIKMVVEWVGRMADSFRDSIFGKIAGIFGEVSDSFKEIIGVEVNTSSNNSSSSNSSNSSNRPSSSGNNSGSNSNSNSSSSGSNSNNTIVYPSISLNSTNPGTTTITYPVIRLNDFIMHPNGTIIQPNANDTIMGFKGDMPGGGLTVIIEGNVYGTDPDEMAEALAKKMRQSIRI